MYLCSKCFDVMYSKRHRCEKCDAKDNHWKDPNIEIDSKLAFQISVLNKKGYKTKFCCSGHAYEEFVTTYIYFEDKIDSCPEDWYLDLDDDGYIIRGNRNDNWVKLDFVTRENILTKYNNNLLKWVLELEPKENKKVYSAQELMDIYYKILARILYISEKDKKSHQQLYEEYCNGILDEQSEIYKCFEDISKMNNILFMSGVIVRRGDVLKITEIGKKYKIPFTFYTDINELN